MPDTLVARYSNAALQDFLRRKIPSFRLVQEDLDHLIPVNGYENFSRLTKLGEAGFDNADDLLVFSCCYEGELTARSSKKKQFELARRVLKEDFKDGAIFVFYDAAGRFRFSFIRRRYGEDQKYTPWRRYTYFVDPARPNKTFRKRMGDSAFDTLDHIQEAFSVEPLSKQFYKELSHWYFHSLQLVEFPDDTDEDRETRHTNAMIRLITRVIFVWFMKQKNLVPEALFDKAETDRLLNYTDKTGSTYYKAILQNLFFATLNTPREKGRKFVNRQYGVQGFYRYERFIKDKERFLALMDRIPFLNGGLFDNLDIVRPEEGIEIRIDCFSDRRDNETRLKVPDELFFGRSRADLSGYLGAGYGQVEVTGLIDLLKQYDFTIDENTAYDQEVALDPELLGTVFENLLANYNPETQEAARKESGSFYTPRPVVDFMVQETLTHYTAHATGLPPDKVRQLFAENDDQPFDHPDDRGRLVEALSRIKLLDPACGSGAFPMGALQKIVHVLGRLDPDNALWKARQKEIALAETREAFEIGDHEERQQRLTAIEQAFEEGMNEPDYARKLFLIENCIYGVDIQPIAIQIAKLRFFISLLVEQNPHPGRDNFGILALPNLETKFVAANTLIHLPGSRSVQLVMKDPQLEALEKELQQIRHELFMMRTPAAKEKRRKRHREIQQAIGELLVRSGFPADMASAIADWQAFDANHAAGWFHPWWMFGLDSFDVVLGNPPYIQLQKALPGNGAMKYADLYKDEGYATFARTGDIYALFYERGLQLLKPQGLLCYITSNKWLRANYGKSLRSFLAGRQPLLLIDLGPGIFEAATVDTNILLVQKGRPARHALRALTLAHRHQLEALPPGQLTVLEELNEESWIILQPAEQAIKAKIERLGKPLKDWDINIYRGVLTGYNEAFIIDGRTRQALIAADPKSAEIIKPILRGRDIKRYRAEFDDLWLINTHNGYKNEKGEVVPPIDINDYPAVKAHLDQYWNKIEKRADQGVTPYNLRNCAYVEEFEKEKIIYQEIVRESEFLLDKYSNYFCNDTGRIITGKNLEFLLGVLNSKFFFFVVKRFYGGGGLGSEGVRMKHTFFEKCPVPEINNYSAFNNLVNIIISKKEQREDTAAEERQIDLLVYKLYGLSYDEVRVVDPQPPFSREEYDGRGFDEKSDKHNEPGKY